MHKARKMPFSNPPPTDLYGRLDSSYLPQWSCHSFVALNYTNYRVHDDVDGGRCYTAEATVV